jgi:hypothetical protein
MTYNHTMYQRHEELIPSESRLSTLSFVCNIFSLKNILYLFGKSELPKLARSRCFLIKLRSQSFFNKATSTILSQRQKLDYKLLHHRFIKLRAISNKKLPNCYRFTITLAHCAIKSWLTVATLQNLSQPRNYIFWGIHCMLVIWWFCHFVEINAKM